jgi:tetratricopeptide (TPR) repeat protein
MKNLLRLVLFLSVFCKILNAESNGGWMWHGAFPWVYSHADDEWWYMHSGDDGKHYAFKNREKEWYVYSESLKGWALANKTSLELQNQGESLLKEAKFSDALNTFEKSLSVSIANHGENDRRVADAHEGIGKALKEKGEFQKSLTSHENALSIRSKLLGSEDIAVSDSYFEIGHLKAALGKYDEALEFFEKALSIRSSKLKESDPKIAEALNLKGFVQNALAQFTESKESFQTALGIQISAEDGDDRVLAETYRGLSMALQISSDFSKSLQYAEDALSLAEKTFNPTDPRIAVFYRDLTYAYADTGNFGMLIKTAQKAFDITINSLGDNHPYESVSAYICLGDAFVLNGEFEKGEENYIKALNITNTKLGSTHPTNAEIYSRFSFDSEITESQKKASEIFTNVYGENHPKTLGASFGSIIERDYDNDIPGLENILSKLEEIYTANSYILSYYYSTMGVFLSKKDSEKSIKFLQQALSNDSLAYTQKHPILSFRYNALGQYYLDRNDYEQAHYFLDKSIENLESNELGVSLLITTPYTLKAAVLAWEGEFSKAHEFNQKYYDIATRKYTDGTKGRAMADWTIGRSYSFLLEYQTALQFLEKAFPVFEKYYENDHRYLISLTQDIEWAKSNF